MSSQPSRLVNSAAISGAGQPSAASRWIGARLDDAARAMMALRDGLRRRRRFLFVEQSDGAFVRASPQVTNDPAFVFRDGGFPGAPDWRGGEVEFRLSPRRCVFRELELPARAAEFLEGVVRAQIDRITPWRANEAAFGWSAPEPRDGQRIALWIAAAKRGPIVEMIDAAAAAGAIAVSVTTKRLDESAPIAILERRGEFALQMARWRFGLIALLFAAMAVAIVAFAAQYTIGAALAERSEMLMTKIAHTRTRLLRSEYEGDNPAARALLARKRAAVSAIIALEALSRALPDNAYLTDLRLEGDKLDIGGVAANAAELIHDLEKSPHFSHATFTAPTVRAASDKGEVFRIEARVAPLLMVAP
jgi:general secretion pathway protein L